MDHKMDVNVFYQTLDDLFTNNELTKVEPYLTASLSQAKEDEDWQAYIAVCNEMIGFYRSISRQCCSIRRQRTARAGVTGMPMSSI